MAVSQFLRFGRLLVPVLVPALLLSCSALQQAGRKGVDEPPITEQSESLWFSYYQAQFEANGGYEGYTVPPSDQYPEAARQGYERAKVSWDEKVDHDKTELIIVAGLTVVILTVLIIVLSHTSTAQFGP